ncbi:hypothetical protein EKO27_g5188 [Xylaria grammica]|uniref:Fumarylacetoacetase-like C-terminal domain-containing protein n=1 Tax=Xylaria grammica TaxID=363999 RepID=A0A439D6A5_9PEZI|nr:hypothetical protein EKO27_g5188 [Xylaria grammica]
MRFQRVDSRVASVGGVPGEEGEQGMSPVSTILRRVLEENPPDAADAEKRRLPFQPRSYRDFMLFERHYYGAAVGITSLYRPWANRLGTLFSTLTGIEFPFFKPHALWYKQPIFYQSNHLAFYSDGASITYPPYCHYLDVELELGIVLGKPLYNASPEEATAAIAGFCVFNDFSVRNTQLDEMASGFGPQHSKAFANSISATVVSADEVLPHIDHLSGRITINDVVVKEPKVDNWQFSLGQASFSVAARFRRALALNDTAFQLRIGDVVKLEIDGIGSVTNTIVPETS